MSIWFAAVLFSFSLQRPNIALNCPYTLQPAPNYRYCTDPDDRIQLTDGKYTQGYFWTQKSTVGWQGIGPVFVVVDLGRDASIAGASFNTAAGVARVEFPEAIWEKVSLESTSPDAPKFGAQESRPAKNAFSFLLEGAFPDAPSFGGSGEPLSKKFTHKTSNGGLNHAKQ